MRMATRPVIAITLTFAAVVASAPATQAQEKFTYKDGVITFDKKGFKAEYDKLQADLARRARSSKKAARSIFKNTYCIDCAGAPTEKLVCRSLFGGRLGAAFCTLGGAVSCPAGTNVGNITSGPC